MRRFHLVHHFDATGISGVGIVAAGVQMPSGRIVLEWISCARDVERPGAINYHECMEDVIATHGHHGKTEIAWID